MPRSLQSRKSGKSIRTPPRVRFSKLAKNYGDSCAAKLDEPSERLARYFKRTIRGLL
ncbi:hypothetical protein K443DRAFT_675543 [Laccaria amethystina LaAM-08-1]|uniref:Uncharacterized protein n=1 Tax=Laccaria amethystina LaAM-08-1 TaxID=1095629 RepID=A0A0C9Y3T7_9AGAR|nr:hypothetical protein K443DRAFT_675543 [Laccaria amethystina LaAM-08-1]